MKKSIKNFPIKFALIISIIFTVIVSAVNSISAEDYLREFLYGFPIILPICFLMVTISYFLNELNLHLEKKWENKRYSNDPEWEDYKRLRDKFRR